MRIIIFILLVFTGVEVFAQPSNKQAEMLLHGLEDAILRINSGICHITGQHIMLDHGKVENDISVAFDYGKRYYRLESRNRSAVLLTPKKYYEVWMPGNVDSTAHVSSSASMAISPFVDMVDIQALIYYTPIGPKSPFDFQNIYRRKLFAHNLLEYEELSGGIYYLKFDMVGTVEGLSMQLEYWLSQKHDYLPIRCEYSVGYVMEISWEKINNTWVPVAYTQNSKAGFGVEWKIDWKSVNEPIPSDYFNPAHLSENPIPLYTHELGDPLQIGILGKDVDIIEFGSKRSSHWFSNTLFYLGCLFTLIALSKTIYDWWKRRNKKDP